MILEHTAESYAEFEAFTDRFAQVALDTVKQGSNLFEAGAAACSNDTQFTSYCLWLAVKAGL